jgi:hypothetical protein
MRMTTRLATCVLGPALACGVVGAEETFLFVDSGQALGNSQSQSVALGDLDGDGDLDAVVANFNRPNTVWFNRPPCTADINADGFANGEDLTILLADWGKSLSKADLNNDGVANGADLTILLSFWNDCP